MKLYLVCLIRKKKKHIKDDHLSFYRELWAIFFVSSCGELQKVGAPCQMSKNMLMIEFKNNLADMATFGQIRLVIPSMSVC